MATIFDVAKAANVSIASVSLVLRDPQSPRVGQAKRNDIIRIAREMGYTPNLLARGLSKHGTGILGLVVPMADPRYFFNVTISEILAGIQGCLTERSYHLLVHSHQSAKGRITQSEIIQSKATDGVIFINTRATTANDIRATVEELDTARIPFVMINSAQEVPEINYAGVDDIATARQAGDFLIQRGHKNMGMILGALATPTAELLRRGFESALRAARLPVKKEWFEAGEFEEGATKKAVRKIAGLKNRPTALFCASDLMAPYVYEELRSMGLRVPEDIAVVGRGDLFFARFLTPPLTTLAFPFFEIGYRSAELLIDSVKTPGRERMKVLLESSLTVRQST